MTPALRRGFEQDDVAEDVDAGGFPGFWLGFADVGEAREVEHGVRAAHDGIDQILVQAGSRDHLLIRAQVGGGAQVDDGDVMARIGKSLSHTCDPKKPEPPKKTIFMHFLVYSPSQNRKV